MMRPAGITVVLFAYWYAGVVGAASLPPDDQYSPQPLAYRRDVSQGPRGYPNWLQYPQDPSTEFDPPESKPAVTTLRSSGSSWETKVREDSPIRDSKLLDLFPTRWNHQTTGSRNNLTVGENLHLDVPEDSEISGGSQEDMFVADDTFQDQGPGSVEVYKLDLLRENSLLVPEAKRKQLQQQLETSRIKSKIPKKATADEILWKLKPIEPSKVSLPSIFRQPPRVPMIEKLPRINENRKDEVFAVGGVPELQVGCEGLEASERQRRSIDSVDEDSDESEIPLVVVDLDDEPPSGEAYEEMDELLKLKNLQTSNPTPKPRRRADIDPALFNKRRYEDDATFPERGDLGSSKNRGVKVKRSIYPEKSEDGEAESAGYRRENEARDDDSTGSRLGSRKLLWVHHPERESNQLRNRHHQPINENRNESDDLWGFGEDDGAITGTDDDDELKRLRKVEMEKRRRENERRRHEEMERRRVDNAHRSHSQGERSRPSESSAEIERIRQDYERQLEKEQRERHRIENERQDPSRHRHREEERRRVEEANRRREEESRRRSEEEERRRQGPPSALTRPDQSHRPENRSRNEHERDDEERKLRDYVDRNRPYDPRSHEDRRRPEEQVRTRNDDERRRHMEEERRRYDEERRRQTEEEKRRQQNEEHRRRQQQPDENERRRQMDEHRRRQQQQREEEERRRHMEEQRRKQQQPDEYERRRQMEEQRRRQQREEEERKRQMEEERRRVRPNDRTAEEERRRRLEEDRKLQDYLRRNQPVNVARRNNSEIFAPRESDLEEQRRIVEAARQYERNRTFPSRTNEPRSHGPSAPTNSGHRQSSIDHEEIRRRQEAERERRRLEEEERRREDEYRRAESRRREEERLRLEAIRRQEENRRSSWQDSGASRRPTNTPHRGNVEAEVRDREAEELRRQEAAVRSSNNSTRNQESLWKRRMEERERQRAEHEERERVRIENERNSRNNGRRRPPHGDTGFRENRHRGESTRSLEERRRREHARLSSLPVSARIIVRANDDSRPSGRHRYATTEPTPSFGSRGNFDNDIDFPAITPNRPGIAAGRFPVPATRRPPVQSPGACVWAIVQCCPGRNRLTSCFELMGCPGANWDPNPCKSSLADAARAEVMKFYEAAAEDEHTKF